MEKQQSRKFSRISYDSQLNKLNTKKLDILNNSDGYERFLYFEDITELTESAKEYKEKIDELKLKISLQGDDSGVLSDEIIELESKLLYTYVSWPILIATPLMIGGQRYMIAPPRGLRCCMMTQYGRYLREKIQS